MPRRWVASNSSELENYPRLGIFSLLLLLLAPLTVKGQTEDDLVDLLRLETAGVERATGLKGAEARLRALRCSQPQA